MKPVPSRYLRMANGSRRDQLVREIAEELRDRHEGLGEYAAPEDFDEVRSRRLREAASSSDREILENATWEDVLELLY
jgi:hypothetical protein